MNSLVWSQMFDSFVVVTTFILYVTLTFALDSRVATYSSGYVIALRLWRVARIPQGQLEVCKTVRAFSSFYMYFQTGP